MRHFVMLPTFLLTILLTPSFAQYMPRADITFNDDNDRFDVTNIIQEQNRVFRDQPTQMEFDGRRIFKGDRGLVEILRSNRRRFRKNRSKESSRRFDDDDNARINYNRNLASFQRYNSRSNLDPRNLRRELNSAEAKKNGKRRMTEARVEDLREIISMYLQGNRIKTDGRRTKNNPDDEILLQYAVPINLKVKGYLEVPQENRKK